MTTYKLYQELYALEVSKLNQFLDKNKQKLLKQPLTEFVKRTQRISSTLPSNQQELVEIVLAYALKENDENKESDEEYEPDTMLYYEIEDLFQEKRYNDTKHTADKKTAIEHAKKHLGKELESNPHDSQLNSKRNSIKKQEHLLNKHNK